MANSIDCYKCPFSYHTCGYVKFSPKIKPEPMPGCPYIEIDQLKEQVQKLTNTILDLESELDIERDFSRRNFGVQM